MMMNYFDTFAISSSGMSAERLRLNIIANNIANMNTAGRPGDHSLKPYQRQVPLFAENLKKSLAAQKKFDSLFNGAGVKVVGIVHDPNPPRIVYEPHHPMADERGYVAYPNINIANEIVDMITASRSYEANVTAFNAAKNMMLKALEIGRR